MRQYWVVGGDFSSLNFHSLVSEPIVYGPFKTRGEAEDTWRHLSEEYRFRASYRFVITEGQ